MNRLCLSSRLSSHLFGRSFTLLFALLLTVTLVTGPGQTSANAQSRTPDQSIIYVRADAASGGTGTSWASAFSILQEALASAQSGNEIWVAAGVYTPVNGNEGFTLVNGVAIYGGFAGTESSRAERDWEANRTILSGDLDGDDVNSDGNFIAETTADIQGNNAGRLIYTDGAGQTTRLDGLVITAANNGSAVVIQNGSPRLENLLISGNQGGGGNGGGVNATGAAPLIRNVHFYGNGASRGGGLYSQSSTSTLVNVTFERNSVPNQGGGMGMFAGGAILTNVSFLGNSSTGEGGGMNVDSGDAVLTNALFVGNTAGSPNGGGMAIVNESMSMFINSTFVENRSAGSGNALYLYNNQPILRNSVVWRNGGDDRDSQIDGQFEIASHSLIQGDGNTENGNLDGTATLPSFVRMPNDGGDGWGVGGNDDYGDLRLQPDSALKNRGNNSFLPADSQDLDGDSNTSEALPLDLANQERVQDGTVDLGAYEITPPTFTPTASIYLPMIQQ